MCGVWWNRGSCGVCGGISSVWWNRGQCAVFGGIALNL